MGNKRKQRRTKRQPNSPVAVADRHPPVIRPANTGAKSLPPFISALAEVSPLSLLLLCLLVAVSYFPAVWAGFVWDDATITGSREVQNISGLWDIWFSPGSIYKEAHYWPVVYTTFWLEHKLWGYSPAGYHIVNVLFHMANTLLLFHLLTHLKIPAAWVVAALFAIHPTRVEAVLWVIERKDMLSGLFYLSAAWAYIRSIENQSWRFYALALALFLLGLLSKSIVVTLPAALLLWHWWKRDGITSAALLKTLPFFALALGIALADLSLARLKEPIVSNFSFDDRLFMASRALWFYFGKLVWPTNLAVIYDLRAGGWGYVAACAAVAAPLWLFRRRIGKGALVGVLFFAITLGPVLGFVDYGFMRFSFVADRYQYLAGIGVLAVLVSAVSLGTERLPHIARQGLWVATAALLLVLGSITYRQAEIYENPETFFSHIIALNPKAQGAHYNLGNEYKRQGRFEEALASYRITLQQEPNSYRTYNQMGLIEHSLSRVEEAEQHFLHTLEIKPQYAKGLNNLAMLRSGQQRHQEALDLYQTAIKSEPNLAAAHSGMGATLVSLGKPEEALRSFERALAIEPNLQHALNYQQKLRAELNKE